MENDGDLDLKRKIILWDDDHHRRKPALREWELDAIRRRKSLRLLKPAKSRAHAESRPLKTSDNAGERFFKRWCQLMYQQAQKGEELQEIKELLHDFWMADPGLRTDQFKAGLILLFLKNYININPEFAGTPFRLRLEKACELADDYLRANPQPTP